MVSNICFIYLYLISILAPCSLQETSKVHERPAQHAAAAAKGGDNGGVDGEQWSIRDAMNFASKFPTKDDMLKQKPVGMDSDTWEEVCVVYDLCCQHGTSDSRLIQKLLIQHFEGGEETSGHDTSNMANQEGEVIPCGESTNPMEHVGKESGSPVAIIDLECESDKHDRPEITIPEVPGVPPSIVQKAVQSLEQEDTQWDEAVLYRRIGEFLADANPPSNTVDTMQTLDWDMGLADVVAETELDDSPPQPSEVPDKAGSMIY